MAENKYKIGETVTVTDKEGKILYAGVVKGWDYNVCTFALEYDIDYYNNQNERVFTLMGATENRIQSLKLNDRQKGLFKEIIQRSKRYGKLAIANCEKWIAAGYAGGNTTPDKLYCYCGEGNGYQGADITPASSIAVIFDSQEAAMEASGNAAYNGYGEKIVLEPMEAYKFFNILQADSYKVALMALYVMINGN